jgi:hypothetical protein
MQNCSVPEIVAFPLWIAKTNYALLKTGQNLVCVAETWWLLFNLFGAFFFILSSLFIFSFI